MAFYMKMGSKSLKTSGINMGTPLYKCGDPGEEPCPPSQASTDAKAQQKANEATKVYGGSTNSVVNNPDGTTTFTRTRNFTQDGEAKEKPKNLPSYSEVGVSKAEGDAYWASKRNSGSESDSFTTVNLKPYGIQPKTMEIKADAKIAVPKPGYTPVGMPEAEKKTGLVGGSTTFKRKKYKNKGHGQSLMVLKVKDALNFSKGKCPSGGCP